MKSNVKLFFLAACFICSTALTSCMIKGIETTLYFYVEDKTDEVNWSYQDQLYYDALMPYDTDAIGVKKSLSDTSSVRSTNEGNSFFGTYDGYTTKPTLYFVYFERANVDSALDDKMKFSYTDTSNVKHTFEVSAQIPNVDEYEYGASEYTVTGDDGKTMHLLVTDYKTKIGYE